MIPLKIATITDLHHGPDQGQKKGSHAFKLLREFSDWCDTDTPDFVVDLGDRIANTTRDEDLARVKQCAIEYSKIKHPIDYVMGNHDEINGVTSFDWSDAFGRDFNSHVRDDIHPDFRIILYSPTYYHGEKELIAGTPVALNDAEILFLQNALDTNRACIICTHAPLHRAVWEGGPYWGKVYDTSSLNVSDWKPAKTLRKLLRESNTCVVLSGHHHWDALHVYDDVAFIQVNSATDASVTWPHPSGRMGMLTVTDDTVKWESRGHHAPQYTLPRRRGNRQWIMNWSEG